MKPLAIAALLLALSVGSAAPGWAQSPPPAAPRAAAPAEILIKGKVDAVTVYRGQALVTRIVELPAGAGSGEIVVSELPARLVASSIFAESANPADGIEVRSIRYRERPVAVDVRDEVRKVDEQIQQVDDKIAAIDKQQQVLQEERTYLGQLSNFTAPAANAEMTRGVLDAKQLKDLTTFQFEQRKAIADQELKLQQDRRALSDQLTLAQRQRSDVTGKSSRTIREAVVFVTRKNAGAIRVRYLVDGATWSPSYNIRADAARKSANLEYQASIQQMSGEDWNDVSMTLSTASPNLVAAAPTLSPLAISLVARSSTQAANEVGRAYDYQAGKKELATLQYKAENTRGNGTNFNIQGQSAAMQKDMLVDNDAGLNKVAEQLQVLELLSGNDKADAAADRRASSPAEGIVVTYEMHARTDLPSRADQQLVQIDSLTMKGDFYKVAIPVLTAYVYDEATLTNSSKIVFLAGPAASYIGGQFVGNGVLPTVAVGQTFTVGFGIDSSLHATRERLDKTETTQGGNKVVNYAYRLAVENYGTAPATVRLMDRLPTGKDAEVRVNFVDADNTPLSADKEYQQIDRKKGLLRWDVEVPAQKKGSEAFSLTYKMNMEYDRNLAISGGGVLRSEELEKFIDGRK